ncbi:MAG TPA: DUF2721 domain-containing protein [Candidatus Thermoplasmatota archaeon]
MADAIATITATLAPAFLISGASIFLNFTQTRLFRVVDRIRAITGGAPADMPRELLERRAKLLRNSIALGVLTVALTVFTAILLMAGEMLARPRLLDAAPYVFGLAMIALFAALCIVMYDTILSVRSITRPT